MARMFFSRSTQKLSREKLVNQIVDSNIDLSSAIRNPFRRNFILIYFHPRWDTHRSQDRERDSNFIFAKRRKTKKTVS